MQHSLPTDSEARKNIPMASGLLDYFPAALAEVAYVSYVGNEKHNPGEAMHHARGKSMDHADCIMRHMADRGTIDTVTLKDGRTFKVRHSAYVAWRALAQLQQELEDAGEAPLPRGARAAESEFKATSLVLEVSATPGLTPAMAEAIFEFQQYAARPITAREQAQGMAERGEW